MQVHLVAEVYQRPRASTELVRRRRRPWRLDARNPQLLNLGPSYCRMHLPPRGCIRRWQGLQCVSASAQDQIPLKRVTPTRLGLATLYSTALGYEPGAQPRQFAHKTFCLIMGRTDMTGEVEFRRSSPWYHGRRREQDVPYE